MKSIPFYKIGEVKCARFFFFISWGSIFFISKRLCSLLIAKFVSINEQLVLTNLAIMQLYLFFVVAFLCIIVAGYVVWKKFFQVKEAVRRTLNGSLEGLPIGAYVRYVKENRKQYVFSNSVAKTIYGCADIFQSPNWNQQEDDDDDHILISEQRPHFVKERKFYLPQDELKLMIFDKRKLIVGVNEYYIITTLKDVTQEQAQELEVQSIRKSLDMAIHGANIIAWDYNFANHKYRHLYGEYEAESVDALNGQLEQLHPDDRERYMNFIMSFSKGDQPDDKNVIQIRMRNDEQELRHYKCVIQLERDAANNEPSKLIGIFIDITNQVEMQQYLEDVCHRDEIIINNTNSGLAYITPDYMVQWENISICTPDIAHETYAKGELCYKSAYGRETPCEDCLLKRVMESKQTEQRGFVLSNGRHTEVLANPVIQRGDKIEGIVIRVDDVTDRQKMINDLQDAKKRAEESDLLKSAFLANISHEIRTPLNAIVGFSGLISNTDNPSEREQFMRIITNNNELLLRLFNDVLDLSKIEAGMTALNDENNEVILADLFNEIEIFFNLKMDENVKLINAAPQDRKPYKADPYCIKLAMTHFFTNAIKFTKQGVIRFGFELVDNGIRCYVSDTGIGIKEENQKRIFERFEKVDPFTQGTGLGLSICKAIAESRKGKVGVESEEGKGSTFWIWLPINTRDKEKLE